MGMKTAISIPDEIFAKMEKMGQRSKQSRSALYGSALKEYLARHAPEEVTEAMDRVCDAMGGKAPDAFVQRASLMVLRNTEW